LCCFTLTPRQPVACCTARVSTCVCGVGVWVCGPWRGGVTYEHALPAV
jgi:hypothetical protein